MNEFFRLPLGQIAEAVVDFVIATFGWFFDALSDAFGALFSGLDWILSAPPFWVVILAFAAIAYFVKGPWLALGTALGLLVIVGVDQWANAMDTLALVIVAAGVAVLLAIPLGIWAARNDRVSRVLRPVLDFLQTMPAFVYLIPAILLFGVGPVPGIVATIVFAMAPGVRLTELGIRGVDSEVVEAGHAFGASPARILRQIQLPLAMPSIMAGVNQVIMLSLSMVVIAGMVGAGGLGGQVVQALSRIDVALGVEAGVSVVILAIILDRITSAAASKKTKASGRSKAVAAVAVTAVAALAVTVSVGASGTSSSDRPITIAVFNGWDEGIAASELWKVVLEEQGYDVELEYAEPAAVYTGLANGDYDLTLDTWLPITHQQYVDKFGEELVDLGAWNDEAKLTIAVNEDAPIDSLSELADNADLFGNTLVGIDAGSGLVTVTQDAVIPGYGLENMNFVASSTPAMLTELKSATDAGENVAVTLWRPHWAYNAFPIKDLEDPEGLLGDAEGIHTTSSLAFEEDFPEVFAWLSNFTMDNETLYSLEDAMFGQYDGDDYGPVVKEWIASNQEWADALTS